MGNRDEAGSLPHPPAPTPAAVLRWVAAAGGRPWFPSQHAAETSTDRDALDDPLNRLRVAGLVKVATWVRGLGQGYVLTPDGEAIAADGRGLPALPEPSAVPPPAYPTSAIPDDPPVTVRFTPIPGIDPPRAVVTPVLLVANLLWYFVGVVIALRLAVPLGTYLNKGNGEVLHQTGAVTGDDLLAGEWWRLASSCFVHGNLVHLALNMVALGMVGPLAELLWGRWRVAVIYAASGLAGGCLAMALRPDALLVGASGAIWGLMMSLVTWFLLYRDRLPPVLAAAWGRRLMLVVLINGAASFLPGISWEGHLGGGLAGFVTAGLLNATRTPGRRRVFALVLLALLPGLVAARMAAMARWGEAWGPVRARAEAERRHRAAADARAAFNRDVVPLLDRLRPEPVLPAGRRADWGPQRRANELLLRRGPKRDPAELADVRAQLLELKSAAETAAGRLTDPPIGVESIDRHRARAKEFVDARAKSLGLLLAMLNADAVPAEAAWNAWGAARRAADAAWEHIAVR